jgi:hypothetical protein
MKELLTLSVAETSQTSVGDCDLYQSPSQSSQKTAVDDPLLKVPLLAGGTE